MIQQIKEEDMQILICRLKEIPVNIPIIYDAFYYGANLAFQPSLSAVISIASAFPQVPVVVAHSGGHHVLDYFYHLRELPNIFYDLSFSAVYLHGTSEEINLKKLIRHTDRSRVIFGTDYPYVVPSLQLQACEIMLSEASYSKEEIEMFFYSNAKALFTGKKV